MFNFIKKLFKVIHVQKQKDVIDGYNISFTLQCLSAVFELIRFDKIALDTETHFGKITYNNFESYKISSRKLNRIGNYV